MKRNEYMTKCAIDYEWKHQDDMTDPSDSFMLRDAYCRGWKAADANPNDLWVNVSEKLPEDKQLVLVAFGPSMMLCRFFNQAVIGGKENKDVFCMSDGVVDVMDYKIAGFTHWMPRPESPKEKEDRL